MRACVLNDVFVYTFNYLLTFDDPFTAHAADQLKRAVRLLCSQIEKDRFMATSYQIMPSLQI